MRGAALFNPRGLANNNGTSGKMAGDVHQRLTRYFGTSVFSQPAAYTFGNTSVTSPDLHSPSFGVVSTQANSPRQIQFGLKLLF